MENIIPRYSSSILLMIHVKQPHSPSPVETERVRSA